MSQSPEELTRFANGVASKKIVDAPIVRTGRRREPCQQDSHPVNRGTVNTPPGGRGSLHRVDARLESLPIGLTPSIILANTLQQHRRSAERRSLVARIDE